MPFQDRFPPAGIPADGGEGKMPEWKKYHFCFKGVSVILKDNLK